MTFGHFQQTVLCRFQLFEQVRYEVSNYGRTKLHTLCIKLSFFKTANHKKYRAIASEVP